MSFTVALMNIKNLTLNLTKGEWDLDIENYKILLRNVLKHSSKWKKDTWIRKFNIVKMTILPKMISGFNTM